MTDLWNFVINRPEDLQPFFDLLVEFNHPNAVCVQKLIEEGRFPWYDDSSNSWDWDVGSYLNTRSNNQLPSSTFKKPGWYEFHTATEAVWAVVNAGRFR